jgi:ATP-dependent DNA helicase RecG
MLLPDSLLALIQQGEGLNVEFKRSAMEITSDVYETVCSFSNREGGHIFLGVKDNGEILGVQKDRVDQMKKNFVTAINNRNKINPPLYINPIDYEFEGKTIIYIQVPCSQSVCRCSGKIFDRNYDSDLDITDNEGLVYQLYARKQDTYYVNKVFPVFTIADLRHDLIDRARTMAKFRTPDHPWQHMTDMELLRSAALILTDTSTGREGLTLAAILLFGSDNLIVSALAHHKTDTIFRVFNTDRYDDREVIITNLLESHDRLIAFGKKHLNDFFVTEGMQSISARDKILREVISKEIVA